MPTQSYGSDGLRFRFSLTGSKASPLTELLLYRICMKMFETKFDRLANPSAFMLNICHIS